MGRVVLILHMKRARDWPDENETETERFCRLEAIANCVASHAPFDVLVALAGTCAYLRGLHYRVATRIPTRLLRRCPADQFQRFSNLRELVVRAASIYSWTPFHQLSGHDRLMQYIEPIAFHSDLLATKTTLTSLDTNSVTDVELRSLTRLTSLSVAGARRRVSNRGLVTLTALQQLDMRWSDCALDATFPFLPNLQRLVISESPWSDDDDDDDDDGNDVPRTCQASTPWVPSLTPQWALLQYLKIDAMSNLGPLFKKPWFAALENLTHLHVSDRRGSRVSPFSYIRQHDGLMDNIASLPRLRVLTLSGFRISYFVAHHFRRLAHLVQLNVLHSDITFRCLVHLRKLRKLVLERTPIVFIDDDDAYRPPRLKVLVVRGSIGEKANRFVRTFAPSLVELRVTRNDQIQMEAVNALERLRRLVVENSRHLAPTIAPKENTNMDLVVSYSHV